MTLQDITLHGNSKNLQSAFSGESQNDKHGLFMKFRKHNDLRSPKIRALVRVGEDLKMKANQLCFPESFFVSFCQLFFL